MAMRGSILGNAVTRVEDPRFLRGEGRYMDDIRDVDALNAIFVRSTFAHAKINGIDTTGAKAMPGVVGVYTAADLQLPGFFAAAMLAGMMPNLARPPLATDTVRHVGEAVAVVLASTRVQATDAAMQHCSSRRRATTSPSRCRRRGTTRSSPTPTWS
jgi:carbon-monoxide dehydrogenase large subunit